MKTFKLSVFMVAALTAMALVQGCAFLLLGGAAAGATYGTVKYVNNTLHVTHDVSLDKAWGAANAALKELQMPVTASKKDGASGRLQARNALTGDKALQIACAAEHIRTFPRAQSPKRRLATAICPP